MITKNTSIQSWNQMVQQYFHKSMRIEDRKDRQRIFELMDELGLPHEKLVAIAGKEFTKEKMLEALRVVGDSYWLSLTPVPASNLNRLTLLNVQSVEDGVRFIEGVEKLDEYKILVIQYFQENQFTGSALVSKSGRGIVEFDLGNHHPDLAAGSKITSPLLFESESVKRFSETIGQNLQEKLLNFISQVPGHFEFKYSNWGPKGYEFNFIDYNDELAYEDIEKSFELLLKELTDKTNTEKYIVKGLIASPGTTKGIARIIKTSEMNQCLDFNQGDILITEQTSPDMTPLMAKAGAIVTDLGGVTCHAAIVCRELKLPCIVGTKNATQKIANKQQIFVNAMTGTVHST